VLDGLTATLIHVLAETWRADLAFLAVLGTWTLATWMAFMEVAPAWRKPLMLGSSLLFMALMLPGPLCVFLIAFAVILREVCVGALRHEKWWLPAAIALLGAIYVPVCWRGTFLEYSDGRLAEGSLLPYLLLWLTFRKCVYLVYEVYAGRIRQAPLAETLLHLFFLPFLAGRSPVVSWTSLWDHWVPDMTADSLRHGAVTLLLAICALFGRTAITLLAAALAIDLGFGRDLETRSALAIWATLDLGYLRKYLYRYGFEQSSIGLLRLFGFQLRDNYEGPLAAHSYADLWRRWNLHFRGLVVGLFYYPTLLRLGRRWRDRKRHAVAAAVFVTFGGHLLLLFQSLSMALDPADPTARLQTFASLAVFDLLQATLVVLALLGPPLLPRWLHDRPALKRALGIVTTFHLRALVFLFFHKGTVVSPVRALALLARAFGLRR